MAEETADTTEVVEDRPGEEPIEAELPEGLDPAALERREQALSQVVKFGDPVLRSVASPVEDFDERLAQEVARMVALMRDGMGVGLAATQLGILRRIAVFQAGPDAPPTALVNPTIEWRSGDLVTAEEGCLSLPGVVVDVERPLHVRVRAMDAAGDKLSIEASGLEARVIQHEVDHLDGVLMLQHAPREQRGAALRALREGDTYAPPRETLEEHHDQGQNGDGADEGPEPAQPAG
jgi:peptide deformylase